MANTSIQNRRRRKQRLKRIADVLSVCSIIVLTVCTAYLIKEVAQYFRSEKMLNELRAAYYASLATNTAATELNQMAEAPSNVHIYEDPLLIIDAPSEPVLQPQFTDLYQENNDLVGWLHVSDDIDYPLVWREGDNDFYMSHDFNGKSSNAGWIFLDKRNSKFMDDDNLLIYGHNMRFGDMFGKLNLYRELDYVKENPIIEIQSAWEAKPRKYVIVSLFDASMDKDHDSYVKITNFNFETPEDKQSYIDELYRRSLFELPCETNADDQLVTLVTCSYSQTDGRLLVFARELRDDETPEQITEMFAELK